MTPDTRTALIAAVDQKFAATGANLDSLVAHVRGMLACGKDRTVAISTVYTGLALVDAVDSDTDQFRRALALAVVRLAEQPGTGAGEQS